MSNFLEWIDSYSIGVPDLDEDHKKMVKLANAMLLAVNDHKGSDLVGECLVELMDAISTHHQREEVVMQNANYPNFEHHKLLHRQLEDMAFTFNEQYRKGELDVVNLCNFLLEIVMEHINGTDNDFGNFIATREPKKETG